ncbi:MAG: serine hydrolase [Pseudomonadota bacterium]
MKNREISAAWRALIVAGLILLGGCGGGSSGGPPPLDTDGDGIADATDTDDDNDGVNDTNDAFPLDPTETADFDSDGIGDNADPDDDNDGVDDTMDAFPFDASESQDSDNDGTGDNADAFPNDPNETSDNDADGIGDNADPDDDNDGVDDTMDAFPTDPTETTDTDGDGIGNNADPDDDNDGVDDTNDAFPLDASESSDNDGDGIGDNADPDDDNDGTPDANDDFPTNAARTQPIQPLFPLVNGQFQLPNTPAASQMTWVVEQLAAPTTSLQDINDRFDPTALAAFSAAEWQGFFDTLRSAIPNGTIQDIITMTPTNIRVLIGDAANPGSGQFMTLQTRYGTGLITSFGASGFPLNGSSTGAADQSLTYTTAADKLETLAEDVGVLVARIDENNQCVPIFERNSATPLATASIFKVWVMGALSRAIEDGIITPEQLVALNTDDQVLGGSINSEPLGTEFTVTDMAALMLGISDNTATEHLFNLVGRDRNEAILTEFNHANLDEMLPFLSMNEGFHLYFTVPEVDALAYVDGDEQFQRDYLDNTLDPLGPVTNFSQANISVLVRALWQGSPQDVCAAIAGLRQFNDRTDGFAVADQAYGAETFVVNLRNQWERVWFKGGSLSDGFGLRVLTYGWLVETDSRGAFVVVTMGNNDSGGNARIDEGGFASVASRIIDIVNETN